MKEILSIPFEVFERKELLSDEERALYEVAKEVREEAYAPYSNFFVGCALLLENGTIVKGSNQENAAFPSSLCAERTTIHWTSANNPGVKIKKIMIVGAPKDAEKYPAIPPCGACRQSMLEYEVKQNESIEIYFTSVDGPIYKVSSVKDLLPFSFDQTFL